jgi:hypothetical protein
MANFFNVDPAFWAADPAYDFQAMLGEQNSSLA